VLINEVIANTGLRTYAATVRVLVDGGAFTVTTSITAQSATAASKLLARLYGRGNVGSVREVLGEAEAALPHTPDQLKVQSLQQKKKAVNQQLKAERSRQRVARAQKSLQQAQQSATA
jgi:hypothetical protein